MTEALRDNLTRLAQTIGDECRSLRTLINGNEATLSDLATTNKESLVAAINELKSLIGQGAGAAIDDEHTRSDRAWSSSKISSLLTTRINLAQAQIVANAPQGLNTLEKIATAIGNQTSLYDVLTQSLNARVRTDTDHQGLSSTERQNARVNIGAASQNDLGPDVDYAALFRNGLLP